MFCAAEQEEVDKSVAAKGPLSPHSNAFAEKVTFTTKLASVWIF